MRSHLRCATRWRVDDLQLLLAAHETLSITIHLHGSIITGEAAGDHAKELTSWLMARSLIPV
jgi:hypothetical protein